MSSTSQGWEHVLVAGRACSQVCWSRMNWAIPGCWHGFLWHSRATAAMAAASCCSKGWNGRSCSHAKLPAVGIYVFTCSMSLPQTLWEHLVVAHQGKVLEILKKKAPHKIFALSILVCRSSSSLVSQTCFTRLSKRFPEHPGGFLHASSTIGLISASVSKVIIPPLPSHCFRDFRLDLTHL